MVIRGTTRVRCPACNTEQDAQLVQTIDPRENPADKEKLLAGELNVLACTKCSTRTPMASTVLYQDGVSYCQVVPGGEKAMDEAAAAFAVSGVSGRRRLVPSLNALVEKVKLWDAGLDDRYVEMTKVLLLASVGAIERVLLFDATDGGLIHWVMFDEDNRAERVSSPLAQYEKLTARPMADTELRVDRAWALDAVKAMVVNAN